MFHNARPKSRTFHTIQAVAEQLGYSTKTIRRWIAAGRLKAHRVGHQWRIAETDLQDFLNRCRV